jgi:hypothetical protein
MRSIMESKKCSKCKVYKHFTEFHKHIGYKFNLSSWCKQCKAECQNRYYSKNKEKIKIRSRIYYSKPEVKKRHKERSVVYDPIYKARQEVRDREKNNYLLRKYGITLTKYIEMLQDQNNSCAICKKDRLHFKRDFAVDHNHSTKRVRALLCFHCNKVKVSKHTIETAKMVLDYLLKYDVPV